MYKRQVEGNTIPTASYVFPDEATYNEDGYNQDVTSQKYNSATTYVLDLSLIHIFCGYGNAGW